MYNSERLIFAIGELSDEKIERAGAALGYRKPQRAGFSILLSRMLAAAAVFVLMLGVGVTAYPIYIHWSRGMEQKLPATGEEQIYAADSGLSQTFTTEAASAAAAKQESREEFALYDNAPRIISSTVNGITISVEQTIIDRDTARIALKIENFRLPEGELPDFGNWSLTVGGESAPNVSASFVEERDEAGNLIFTAPDRSMEIDFSVIAGDKWPSLEGREIRIVIGSLGCGDKGRYEPLAEGPWELDWMPGISTELASFLPDVYIGDTGIRLVSAEIAPISAKVVLALPKLWEGYQTLEHFDLRLVGVALTDGTVLTNIFSHPVQEGYADLEQLHLELVYSSTQIVKPEQVDSLIFARNYPWARELSAEDLISVPVH